MSVHAFTSKAKGLANVLIQEIEITLPNDRGNIYKTHGIWDTGASGSVISANIVKALGLKPSGTALVNTASEKGVKTSTYLVDLYLNQVRIKGVVVSEGSLIDGFECLIGMDVISLGDFAVTNFEGKTTVTFRVPSLKEIDFIKELREQEKELAEKQGPKSDKKYIYAPMRNGKVDGNLPCPCGSKRKWKQCHGKQAPKYSPK